MILNGCDGHDHHGDHSESRGAQDKHRDTVEVSSFANAPKVQLRVLKDRHGGWNIEIQTEHFRFAPENVTEPAVEGEGHAHLYIDGEKVARIYGHWYHLADLKKGKHTIRVTLNANDHGQLVNGGTPLMAEAHIEQP